MRPLNRHEICNDCRSELAETTLFDGVGRCRMCYKKAHVGFAEFIGELLDTSPCHTCKGDRVVSSIGDPARYVDCHWCNETGLENPPTAAVVAGTVLDVLRHFRDHEQREWDAMTKTESGSLLLNLWDALREIAGDQS